MNPFPQAGIASQSRGLVAWLIRMLCPKRLMRYFGPSRHFAVSFVDVMEIGQVIADMPTVVEVGTADLRVTHIAVNTVDLRMNGKIIPPGYAAQFRARGFLDTTKRYRFKIAATLKQWAEPTIPSLRTPPIVAVTHLEYGPKAAFAHPKE